MDRLVYCEKSSRWQVVIDYSKSFPVHCGEYLLIGVNGEYLSCRVEFDTDWYVIFPCDTRFYLDKKRSYLISLF